MRLRRRTLDRNGTAVAFVRSRQPAAFGSRQRTNGRRRETGGEGDGWCRCKRPPRACSPMVHVAEEGLDGCPATHLLARRAPQICKRTTILMWRWPHRFVGVNGPEIYYLSLLRSEVRHFAVSEPGGAFLLASGLATTGWIRPPLEYSTALVGTRK